jgi:hypothetical protein
VTNGGLDLPFKMVRERDIQISSSSSTQDEHVTLAGDLLVETPNNEGGGRLVHDAEVGSDDCPSILGGLTLQVVEVGRDGDDGVDDVTTQVPR